MTQTQFVLLAMTAACIGTAVALHRQRALSTTGLALVTAVAVAIAAVMYLAQ